jgi:hypothetical protein
MRQHLKPTISILLIGAMLMLPLLLVPQSPKEALNPKTYAQISGTGDTDTLRRIELQMAALKQSIEDQGHRIDIHRTEIDALQPEVEAVRIAALEQDIKLIKEEKRKQEDDRLSDRSAMMNWFRGIAGGVLTSIIIVGFNAFLAHRRENIRLIQMQVLTKQTDGMTGQISRLSEAKGHSDEIAGILQTSYKEESNANS